MTTEQKTVAEQDVANRVYRAVRDLNLAVADAAEIGLVVEFSLVDSHRFDGLGAVRVQATVKKQLGETSE